MLPGLTRYKPESMREFRRRKRRIQQRFKEKCGYAGNFIWPRDYCEKVQYRKLWGNHAFYAMVADKYRVRDYVAEKVGEQYLIPLLGVYDRLTPDIFDQLPERFVINTNHGCGWHKIVLSKQDLDIEATCNYFNQVVQQVYGRGRGEYHYGLINPKILVLELLTDEGRLPYDYDIFCYNSNEGFDYAITLERPGDADMIHFDRDWNLIEGTLRDGELEQYVNPRNFPEMIDVAKSLSSDFDFVRIDLYNVEGRIYFGEITVTPAAGFNLIKNEVRAAMRANMWKLDVNNELLYRKPWARRLQFWKR